MQENEVKASALGVTKSPDQTEASASKADMPAGSGGNGRPKIPSEPAFKGVAEGRHQRKCHICNHADRAAIEFDFINWRNPAELVKSFQLRDLSTIYRHAHATGLFARRRLNLRGLMERIAERVSEVPITAAAIIRAARAIAHINDAGEWIDPPTRIIVEHHYHSKRKNGSVTIKKVSHAMFTPANLDEPSPEAASRGERPRIDPKSKSQFPTEVVLEIAPALYEASMERKRRAQAACLAQDAKEVADPVADPERSRREQAPNVPSATTVILAPWKTAPSGVQAPCHEGTRTGQPVVDAKDVSGQAPCPEPARQGVGTRTGQPVEGAVVVSGTGSQPVELNSLKSVAAPSSNEQTVAASSQPAGLTLSQPAVAGGVEGCAVNGQPRSVEPGTAATSCKGTASAVPLSATGNPSLLPPAAFNSSAPSALSVHEPRTTEHASRPSGLVARAGSAGSTNPPFPFDPSKQLYRKGRRHRL